MPDGMVELLPSLLVPTKSGPQTAVTATAIHIAVIASDAQTSLTRRARPSPAPEQPWRAGAKWSTSHTSSLMQTLARRSREGVREETPIAGRGTHTRLPSGPGGDASGEEPWASTWPKSVTETDFRPG
jgi:hypothetical protein